MGPDVAYMTWLADVIREAGLDVQEESGWRTRSATRAGMSDIRGVIMHHTAGPATGNYPSLNTVKNGRPGIPGPLSQLGLARDGTVIVMAAGSANHAGNGSWPGIPTNNGNPHLIGIEAESTGRGDWTKAQLDTYPRLVAALLKHLGLPVSRAIAHMEWAPARKIDPAGWPGGMKGFRDSVAAHMEGVALTPEQDQILRDIKQQMTGSREQGEYPGWDWRNPPNGVALTITDMLRHLVKDAMEVRQPTDRAVVDAVNALTAVVNKLAADVAELKAQN